MSKELKELLEKLAEQGQKTHNSIHALDKKLDLHIQKTEYELQKINELDNIQNKLLDQHIEGVNTLKKWCEVHEKANEFRFNKLEEPKKLAQYATRIIITVGSLAAAFTAIAKFLKWF